MTEIVYFAHKIIILSIDNKFKIDYIYINFTTTNWEMQNVC